MHRVMNPATGPTLLRGSADHLDILFLIERNELQDPQDLILDDPKCLAGVERRIERSSRQHRIDLSQPVRAYIALMLARNKRFELTQRGCIVRMPPDRRRHQH